MSYIDSSIGDEDLPESKALIPSEHDELGPQSEDGETPHEYEPPEPERDPESRSTDGTRRARLEAQVGDINLARYMHEDDLREIGVQVTREYEIDNQSRKAWEESTLRAIEFATQDSQPKQYPWPGASNVIWPLISQAQVDFNARTYPALIRDNRVVKGAMWGRDEGIPVTTNGKPDGPQKMIPGPNGQQTPAWVEAPGERRERIDRAADYMSYQFLVEMTDWEPQLDTMLMEIAIGGGAIRKTWFDPAEGVPQSEFVSILNVVWSMQAKSFEKAARHTERLWLTKNQVIEKERAGLEDGHSEGMWLHREYYSDGPSASGELPGPVVGDDSAPPAFDDPEKPILFLEQHRRLDLDGDGYAEPYIVTVHPASQKVVRIVANYQCEDITSTEDGETILRVKTDEKYTLYRFMPSLDGGSYPTGYHMLLSNMNEAISSSLNQMFDAGHLANAGGGFVAGDFTGSSGEVRLQVGTYKRINTRGQAIRDAVMPFDFKGPNATLYQLFTTLVTAAEKLASTQNVLAGDAAIANAPPTTVLALIEQGMRVNNAIQKRIYRAMKEEARKLYRINRRHLEKGHGFTHNARWAQISRDDFLEDGGVEPVTDPSMTTDMQRLGRAAILKETCAGNPAFDQVKVAMRVLEASGVDRVEDMMSPPDPNAAQVAQIALMMKFAELGRERSAAIKDQTQAYLNMAMAREKVAGTQQAQLDSQLEFMRLQIEADNTRVKWASVMHDHYATNMDALDSAAQRAHEQALTQMGGSSDGQPAATPETPPKGPFPLVSGPTPSSAPLTPAPKEQSPNTASFGGGAPVALPSPLDAYKTQGAPPAPPEAAQEPMRPLPAAPPRFNGPPPNVQLAGPGT